MPDIRVKGKLSNNRGNAPQLGLWYVNANNAPSNANATNWGSRPIPQMRKAACNVSLTLNQPPIKSASGIGRKDDCCAGQSPLIRRVLVALSQDTSRTDAMRKRREAA